jgi:hypothetical protein
MFRSNIGHLLEKQRCGNSAGYDFRRQILSHSSLVRKLSLDVELHGHDGCVNRLAWNSAGDKLASVSRIPAQSALTALTCRRSVFGSLNPLLRRAPLPLQPPSPLAGPGAGVG